MIYRDILVIRIPQLIRADGYYETDPNSNLDAGRLGFVLDAVEVFVLNFIPPTLLISIHLFLI